MQFCKAAEISPQYDLKCYLGDAILIHDRSTKRLSGIAITVSQDWASVIAWVRPGMNSIIGITCKMPVRRREAYQTQRGWFPTERFSVQMVRSNRGRDELQRLRGETQNSVYIMQCSRFATQRKNYAVSDCLSTFGGTASVVRPAYYKLAMLICPELS